MPPILPNCIEERGQIRHQTRNYIFHRESLLNSIYLLQANTERLDFSTKFFLEVAKLPFELSVVPR